MYSSGVEGLRYEELPGEWFDYNNAFPTVTGFYGTSLSTAHTEAEGECSLDLDTSKMAGGKLFNVDYMYIANLYQCFSKN